MSDSGQQSSIQGINIFGWGNGFSGNNSFRHYSWVDKTIISSGRVPDQQGYQSREAEICTLNGGVWGPVTSKPCLLNYWGKRRGSDHNKIQRLALRHRWHSLPPINNHAKRTSSWEICFSVCWTFGNNQENCGEHHPNESFFILVSSQLSKIN